jgi:hypothetical protein
MPALGGVRHRRREPRRFALLVAAAIALVAAIVFTLLR